MSLPAGWSRIYSKPATGFVLPGGISAGANSRRLQVKAMKPQEVARTWAEYLSALMRHLTIVQSGDAEAASRAE